MLDDDGRRVGEQSGQPRGPVEVEQVVVGEFLAGKLLETGQTEVRAHRRKERRRLVGIFTVSQRQAPLEFEGQPAGKRWLIVGVLPARVRCRRLTNGRMQIGVSGHPAGDGSVVGSRAFEGAGRKPAAFGERGAATGDRRQEVVVLLGAGHHGGEGMVLGRCPHEARPADVDQFDRFASRAVGPGDGRLEGIQVHDHGVEGVDAVGGEHGAVVGAIMPREHAGEDPRVERLHPAVEDLGKGSDRRDILDLEPMAREGGARAAGAHHANTRRLETGGEPAEAGLVEDAHEDAADRNDVHGGRGGRQGGMGM